MYETYIPDLHDKYIIVGSVGRKTYHKQLMEIFEKQSETIPKMLQKDYEQPITKHDMDLLCVGDRPGGSARELAERYKDILIAPKTLTLKSDILTLKRTDGKYPQIKRYNLFVARDKDELPYYFFYSLLGDLINIIMRIKIRSKGLLLNRHGLFKDNKLVKLDFTDDLFQNLEKIVSYIYE